MYDITLLSQDNITNFILFILLTFIGSAVRVSIDIELNKQKVKKSSFFNRWFIATVISYIIEIFISEKEFLRKYYSEIIIFFCIFVNDIIKILIFNSYKIIIYLLNTLTKGIIDLRSTIEVKNKEDNDNNDRNK